MDELVFRLVQIREVFDLVMYAYVVLPLNIGISAYRYVYILCSGSELYLYVQLLVFIT